MQVLLGLDALFSLVRQFAVGDDKSMVRASTICPNRSSLFREARSARRRSSTIWMVGCSSPGENGFSKCPYGLVPRARANVASSENAVR